MRKDIKKLMIAVSAATLSISTVLTASAGQMGTGRWINGTGENQNKKWFASAGQMGTGRWINGTGENQNKKWFALSTDGSSYVSGSWYWIKDADGIIRCYYFDKDGWAATDTVVDNFQLDTDGHWVVDGVDQTGTEETAYVAHSDAFTAQSTPTNQVSVTIGAEENGPSKVINTVGTGMGSKAKKKAAVKSTGRGDNPGVIETATADWALSDIAGAGVVNAWANFSMNLGSYTNTTKGSAEMNYDFSVETDGADMIVKYSRLDQYTPGNTSLDVFVNDYKNFGKNGFKNGAMAEDIALGAYTFKQIRRLVVDPSLTLYDCAYIRLVEGTNYAQIITVNHYGETTDFLSALKTMARVR